MDRFRVTYRLAVDAAGARARAEDVAHEQTVEVPPSAVVDPFVADEILGSVEAITPAPDGGQLATIAYPVATTAADPAQLLNVVFGNSSLQADVECVDLELPAALLRQLRGPRHGIAGLRRATGVYDRALTCTAVKPMGQSAKALADLLRVFARSGIDVVKDDHGLADHAFCSFDERVSACLAAVDEVAEETGHRALYAPNLIGTPSRVLRQLHVAQDLGARAVLVSPMLIGLPAFWELCQEHAAVPVIAHPSFGGVQRFAPEALFGRLLRLFGADAVIYVNFGSRFARSRESCRAVAERLLEPWESVLPALPVPAGGIAVESAREMIDFYGTDTMLLVGGSLQIDPTPAVIAQRCRAFVDAVRGSG